MRNLMEFELSTGSLRWFVPFAAVELVIVIGIYLGLTHLTNKGNENTLLQKYGGMEEKERGTRKKKKRKVAIVLVLVAVMLPVLALEYVILYGY